MASTPTHKHFTYEHLYLVRMTVEIEFHYLLMKITHLNTDCKVTLASFTFEKIKKNIVEAATQNCSLKLENWKIYLLKKSIF